MKGKDAVVCLYLLVLVCNNQKIATILRFGANRRNSIYHALLYVCVCVGLFLIYYVYMLRCVFLYLPIWHWYVSLLFVFVCLFL